MTNELIRLGSAWPFLLMALLAATVLVLSVVTAQSVGTRLRLEWMWTFFVGVPMALVASVVVRGRDLSPGESALAMLPDAEELASGNLVTRCITLVCLAIALERAVRFWLGGERRTAVALSTMLFMLGFIVSTNILSSLLGTPGGFRHNLLYAPIVAIGMFAYAQTHADQGVIVLRNALFVFFLLSLAALAVRPAWVADLHYSAGVLPGFGVRFYGFATHPNTLAPLSLLLVCAVRLQRFRFAPLNWLAVAVGLVSLLLTQSKTSIVLAVLGLLYLGWFDMHQRGRALDGVRRGQLHLLLLACAAFAVGLVVLVLLVSVMGHTRLGDGILQLADRLQLTTVTGRTRIWDETIRAALDNPMFGYGPGLWDVPFRNRVGLPFTHAHNQFVHTFGAAGVVGLGALLAYLVSLARLVWRTRIPTHGVGVMLFGYLLLRGLTELPLNISNAMQGEFIVQMFILTVCVGALRAANPILAGARPDGGRGRVIAGRAGTATATV